MARKVFTDEEIEMLRKNPYTYVVTPKMIKFTQEFKELFWKEYQNDVKPGKIFENTDIRRKCWEASAFGESHG